MLKKAMLAKEISVLVENEMGILHKITDLLADHGINIEAVAGYEVLESKNAEMMFVVDDTLRASDALKAKGYGSVDENDVIVVEMENKPGALKTVTRLLAAKGINIRYIYGSVGSEATYVRVVMLTSDNEKALIALKKSIPS
jgi:hypothetical protein